MEEDQEIESTLKMLADYMEGGYLENIIDLFRHDKSYYPFIGRLFGDERQAVRIGTMALVETLLEEHGDDIFSAIPGIAALLKDTNPTIRGDAAHLLGIIGHEDALPFLRDAVNDEHYLVRETVEEAIEEIKNSGSG
ncbi:MAG: HEAT repeat domain-containing protein [Nitrospirota bacterium]|nr:HEAT repeat domain-containing protein [Nitrospirota bacterium]